MTLQIVFFLLAIGSVVFGANVVLRKNPAMCAVHLVGCFFCLAGIYLLIGFPFLAALQLMVYAGAIMVLFIFVIMLLDVGGETDARRESGEEAEHETPYASLLAPLLAGGILGLLATVYPDAALAGPAFGTVLPDEAAAAGGKGLAIALFGKHVLAFEAASLLLLAGIVGVIILAKRRLRPTPELIDVEPARSDEPAAQGCAEAADVGGPA